jgi:hypothetical protein
MNRGAASPSPRPTSRYPRPPAADHALQRPQSAAIRGASKAFTTWSNPPRSTANASNGQNGAIAAAAAAGVVKPKKTTLQAPIPEWHAHLLPKPAPRRVSLVQDRVKQFEEPGLERLHHNTGNEIAPGKRSTSQSPSHLAAKLAAQRSTPISPATRPTFSPALSPSIGTNWESTSSPAYSRSDPVIQPSTTTPIIASTRSPIVAPKPIRPQPSKVTPLEAAVAALQTKRPSNSETHKSFLTASTETGPKDNSAAIVARAASPFKPKRPVYSRQSSTQSDASWRTLPPDTHPQPLSIQKTRRSDDTFSPISPGTTSSASFYSTTSHPQGSRNPSATSLPLATVSVVPTKLETNTAFPKLTDTPTPILTPTLPRNQRPYRPPLMQQSTGPTIDSLASAIVASSVATSRATSPTRSSRPPPRPPSRHHKSPSHHHAFPLFAHHTGPQPRSRPPSPPKAHTLKTTMRERSHSTDATKPERDKKYHKHNHLIRKAPNKHHEGSRQRWRDEVPEAARKRYEGVWAANKGYLLPSIASATQPAFQANSDIVVNVVVRDIWSRSRLPQDVLEEVWELVDRKHAGVLFRDEFVVGMWLIDQRLKGRKLPGKVGESVWDSVRYLKDTKIWRYKQ